MVKLIEGPATVFRQAENVGSHISIAPCHDGPALPALGHRSGRDFALWLDRSGLALAFFGRLQQHKMAERLSPDWCAALRERLARNIERTRYILAEAERINAAFRMFGATAATIKGFTLTPDFCDDLDLRHQVDLRL